MRGLWDCCPNSTQSQHPLHIALPSVQTRLSLHSRIGANPLPLLTPPAAHSLSFRAESAGADGVEESPRPAVNPVTTLSPRCKPAVTPHSPRCTPACHYTLSSVQTRCHSSLPPLHTRCHSERSLPGLTESRNLPARQSTLSLHSLIGANPLPLLTPPAAHSLSFRAESAGADGVEESARPAVNPVTALSHRCKSAVIPSGVCRG